MGKQIITKGKTISRPGWKNNPDLGHLHPDRAAYEGGFLRLRQVLEIIPVSRSTWLEGVRIGIYPAPISLSQRTRAWPRAKIYALCDQLMGTDNTA